MTIHHTAAFRRVARALDARGAASSGSTLIVSNPYDGEAIAELPLENGGDARRKLQTAARFTSTLSRHDRIAVFEKAIALLAAEKRDASILITLESGLCRKDTMYEIERVINVLRAAIAELNRDDSQTFSCDNATTADKRKIFTVREPLRGVVAAITPFNHPMNQIAHKICPAIASNNRVVLKPSEKTPLSALYLLDLFREAGLPEPMFDVVIGAPDVVGAELVRNDQVELVAFTGSVAVGKRIAEMAGYRRTILELGGNDPLIVMEDADLDRAAQLAVKGSYKNSGQRCTAVKRILVERTVAGRFTELLVEHSRRWKIGDPMDEHVDIGTLIDDAAAIECARRVDEAIDAGARVLLGHRRDGAAYAPTVLDRVDPALRLAQQETFGPVSPVIAFSGLDEAVAIANSTRYGLSSGVCTNRLDYITHLIANLDVGTVNVWEVPGFRLESTPFGGVKDSGLGSKEGMQEAIKNFTNLKTYSLPWDTFAQPHAA
ncbi:phosphonoacetaldehyde dehydrogenase [Burkholderia oklahomensis]|uniref:phosphonoacetaldehyde dehydrogenase n=1 Tax=Burkholderia oklahomensis TaxID=342113 RepID=UPI00016A6DF3|nr:phosphonoacetaldehyde dehydrogenase [Burkholderia oklahomensis]AJX34496.1 putative phosphonoacetaldehyde dehydrogenase [Burkholderia oklahomensis C6786]AOI49490.1 phosphonoacetaldehyde dehydrogenase [Burkholderia oklahomensis C6786]KUY62229.1 phosphonoacetaldehyde dehydrogenase [Burkholderia oklahomensis C6786]MBI0362235.1 phosphonoacetaldehyde dehydrogenase [Burkholderia oklahomensis]MDN7674650.1 phosphonoacetaldehyde dehydrogenase [Burkholderia oklahomensis]